MGPGQRDLHCIEVGSILVVVLFFYGCSLSRDPVLAPLLPSHTAAVSPYFDSSPHLASSHAHLHLIPCRQRRSNRPLAPSRCILRPLLVCCILGVRSRISTWTIPRPCTDHPLTYPSILLRHSCLRPRIASSILVESLRFSKAHLQSNPTGLPRKLPVSLCKLVVPFCIRRIVRPLQLNTS